MEPFEFFGRKIVQESKVTLFAQLIGVSDDKMKKVGKLFKPPGSPASENGSALAAVLAAALVNPTESNPKPA